MGYVENERIRKTHGLNLIGQMTFDVRLRHMPCVNESYNTITLQKLEAWTQRRSDVATLEPRATSLLTGDRQVHDADGQDVDVVDYIDEELDNTVGYFKENDSDE